MFPVLPVAVLVPLPVPVLPVAVLVPLPAPVLPVPVPLPPPEPFPLPLPPLPPPLPVRLPVPVPLAFPVPLPSLGGGPPEADDTGIVVVVVTVVGVVVVVVVVVAGGAVALDPPPVGAEEPVPTTVRVAVGVEPPSETCAGFWAAAATAAVGALPVDEVGTPMAWVPVPVPPAFGDPLAPAAGAGVVVAGGVPPSGEVAEPGALAANCGDPVGPEPRFSPATIDSAAAATEADATNRLRTK